MPSPITISANITRSATTFGTPSRSADFGHSLPDNTLATPAYTNTAPTAVAASVDAFTLAQPSM